MTGSSQHWLQCRSIVFITEGSVFVGRGVHHILVLCHSRSECVLDQVDATPAQRFGAFTDVFDGMQLKSASRVGAVTKASQF